MKTWFLAIVVLVVLGTVLEVQGRRGGGRSGGGRSSSRSGGWGSRTSSRSGGRSRGWGGSSGGRKSSLKSKLVKGAVIGAGVYVGYKATKALGKFAAYGLAGGRGYEFNDWNRWRQSDGMLCRNNADCWLDPQLECQDYELDFSINRGWFGGDYLAIRGQCQCRNGFWFNEDRLECQVAGGFWTGVVGILIILLILSCMGCCCVALGCYICRKMMN